MTLRSRTVFFVASFVVVLLFFYIERAILTPFVVAAIFAYIFNPLINLFSKFLKFPRALSIILVYMIVIFSVIYSGSILTRVLLKESGNILILIENYISYLKQNIDTLPQMIRPYISSFSEFPKLNIDTLSFKLFPIFTFAFSGIFNFFIFIFATFFFLKDNEKFSEKILNQLPQDEKVELSVLVKKINNVLSKYLRGQIILIFCLALILYLAFSFLGVNNALTISIVSALAGIVPMIGTIVAIIVGTFVIVLSGGVQAFQLGFIETVLLIIGVYYGAQLIQDYILSPYVLGKAVKLHPLVILFAALAGGNIGGILGLILAVPIAATVKIILEFVLDKINNRDYLLRKE